MSRIARIKNWLAPGIIFPSNTSLSPDRGVPWSAIQQNLNFYALTPIVKTGAVAANNLTLTAAEVLAGMIFLDVTNGAGFTLTLPSTASILAPFGQALIVDGSYAQPFEVVNNNVGQTATLTVGDASTTLTGTMTIATNVVRQFLLIVTGAGTLTIRNRGFKAI